MAIVEPVQNGTARALKPFPPRNASAQANGGTATTSLKKRWQGWPEDYVFRLIMPVGKVGSIIGRKGELIKKMCEDTRARIRVLHVAIDTLDRIVTLK